MSAREKFSHLVKSASFPSPTEVKSHNPTPFGAQRPRWLSFPSPIDVRSHKSTLLRSLMSSLAHRPVSSSDIIGNNQSSPLVDSPFWPITHPRHPHRFQTCLLRRSFHTLVRNTLFPAPTNVGSHNLYVYN